MMEGNCKKSDKKRKGSSQGHENISKKSVREVEEAMVLDEYEIDPAASCPGKTHQGSYLCRIVEMAKQTADSNQENLCHLASLANLALDEKAASELIAIGIEKKIGGHLLNRNLKIQEKVAGIFRNLSISGGVDACLSLVRNGIVAQGGMALKDNVKQIHSFISSRDNENLEQVFCCLKQLVSLLCNLCEASEAALLSFNEQNVLVSLLEALHSAKSDKGLLLNIVQCLSAVTEENNSAIDLLVNSKPSIDHLIRMLDNFAETTKDLLIASTASGVLLNVFAKLEDGVRGKMIDKMLEIIAFALDKCFVDELKELFLNVNCTKSADSCLDLITAKQTCLELLANLLCYEDDNEMMETSDEDSDGSFYDKCHINGIHSPGQNSKFQIHVKEFLLRNRLPKKLEQCMIYIDKLELQHQLKENDERWLLHRALTRLQKSALACFSNMLDTNVVDDVTFLLSLWSTLLSTSKPSKDKEFWLELTGCVRALIMAAAERDFYEFLANRSFEILERWYQGAKDEQIKCNLLKFFGIAGKHFSQSEDGEPYLQRIATILCQELVPKNSIIMITEALDTTFDAFGEDGNCDRVLMSSGLANILCQFPPHLKAKVKSTKSIGKPYKSLVHSTRINLDRFISYKKLKQ